MGTVEAKRATLYSHPSLLNIIYPGLKPSASSTLSLWKPELSNHFRLAHIYFSGGLSCTGTATKYPDGTSLHQYGYECLCLLAAVCRTWEQSMEQNMHTSLASEARVISLKRARQQHVGYVVGSQKCTVSPFQVFFAFFHIYRHECPHGLLSCSMKTWG